MKNNRILDNSMKRLINDIQSAPLDRKNIEEFKETIYSSEKFLDVLRNILKDIWTTADVKYFDVIFLTFFRQLLKNGCEELRNIHHEIKDGQESASNTIITHFVFYLDSRKSQRNQSKVLYEQLVLPAKTLDVDDKGKWAIPMDRDYYQVAVGKPNVANVMINGKQVKINALAPGTTHLTLTNVLTGVKAVCNVTVDGSLKDDLTPLKNPTVYKIQPKETINGYIWNRLEKDFDKEINHVVSNILSEYALLLDKDKIKEELRLALTIHPEKILESYDFSKPLSKWCEETGKRIISQITDIIIIDMMMKCKPLHNSPFFKPKSKYRTGIEMAIRKKWDLEKEEDITAVVMTYLNSLDEKLPKFKKMIRKDRHRSPYVRFYPPFVRDGYQPANYVYYEEKADLLTLLMINADEYARKGNKNKEDRTSLKVLLINPNKQAQKDVILNYVLGYGRNLYKEDQKNCLAKIKKIYRRRLSRPTCTIFDKFDFEKELNDYICEDFFIRYDFGKPLDEWCKEKVDIFIQSRPWLYLFSRNDDNTLSIFVDAEMSLRNLVYKYNVNSKKLVIDSEDFIQDFKIKLIKIAKDNLYRYDSNFKTYCFTIAERMLNELVNNQKKIQEDIDKPIEDYVPKEDEYVIDLKDKACTTRSYLLLLYNTDYNNLFLSTLSGLYLDILWNLDVDLYDYTKSEQTEIKRILAAASEPVRTNINQDHNRAKDKLDKVIERIIDFEHIVNEVKEKESDLTLEHWNIINDIIEKYKINKTISSKKLGPTYTPETILPLLRKLVSERNLFSKDESILLPMEWDSLVNLSKSNSQISDYLGIPDKDDIRILNAFAFDYDNYTPTVPSEVQLAFMNEGVTDLELLIWKIGRRVVNRIGRLKVIFPHVRQPEVVEEEIMKSLEFRSFHSLLNAGHDIPALAMHLDLMIKREILRLINMDENYISKFIQFDENFIEEYLDADTEAISFDISSDKLGSFSDKTELSIDHSMKINNFLNQIRNYLGISRNKDLDRIKKLGEETYNKLQNFTPEEMEDLKRKAWVNFAEENNVSVRTAVEQCNELMGAYDEVQKHVFDIFTKDEKEKIENDIVRCLKYGDKNIALKIDLYNYLKTYKHA